MRLEARMTGILIFPGLYVIAQIAAAIGMRGKARVVALIPVVPMVLVAVRTAETGWDISDLWPVLYFVACPAASLFILGVWLVTKVENPPRTRWFG
jgi:hypothetical protein